MLKRLVLGLALAGCGEDLAGPHDEVPCDVVPSGRCERACLAQDPDTPGAGTCLTGAGECEGPFSDGGVEGCCVYTAVGDGDVWSFLECE